MNGGVRWPSPGVADVLMQHVLGMQEITMAQIKIYGLRSALADRMVQLSNAIHGALVEALQLPLEKRFHRFIALDPTEFIHPPERSDDYLIIEISMFEGRSTAAKKQLIRQLYANIGAQTGIAAMDIEITIFETPQANWGIRGLPADELRLNYKVEV